MNRRKYYLLSDDDCSVIVGLLKHYKSEIDDMQDILKRLNELRGLSESEHSAYKANNKELVRILSIITKLL
jgi:hypothetical protein